MAYLNNARRRLPATLATAIAVLPVLAVVQLILSVPASAHIRGYHHHHLARREAAPAQAENFAQPTLGGRQDDHSPQSFNGSAAPGESSPIDGMAASAASAAGIPASLVERVIKRESGGNPRAVSQGNYGLMQIRLGTARAMGYAGSAEGLLDAQTNMTYAVKYLAGAYRAAGGNESRAVALYASGYYAQAKAEDRRVRLAAARSLRLRADGSVALSHTSLPPSCGVTAKSPSPRPRGEGVRIAAPCVGACPPKLECVR
jgi:soluble lytic murein transglycosylase-like protein